MGPDPRYTPIRLKAGIRTQETEEGRWAKRGRPRSKGGGPGWDERLPALSIKQRY